MRVKADSAACQGHGRCALLAPEIFDVDETGKVVILRPEVPDRLHADVVEAISTCPESALAKDAG